MKLKVLNDDGTICIHDINKSICPSKDISLISSSSKEENALNIIKSYYSNTKTIMFDKTNEMIESTLEQLPLEMLQEKEFSQIFFTSGTTGKPVGALKTKQNLEEEVKVFSSLIEKYTIKKVIVTVPFVHIYGTLVGLLYPLFNNIDIILKEHFLPFNLLDTIDEYSLIVTTPLYIKAMNSMTDSKNLNTCVFVSSTAPLAQSTVQEFTDKFNTNLIQLFGSTETGGIAYKINDDDLWTPFEGVRISQNEDGELIVNSPFVSNVLYQEGFVNINGEMQTFDYIEKHKGKFKLVGRSSKILKIAGKRYSTIQIEDILEDIEGIKKALVFVIKNENSLRDEILDITLESKKEFSSQEIKKILKSKLSNLKFLIQLHFVDKISTNAIGKKLIII